MLKASSIQALPETRTVKLPNSFYDTSITHVRKPDQDSTKKLLTNILMNVDPQILHKIVANQVQKFILKYATIAWEY